MSEIPYRQAVGSLMYAMVGTRPDLATSVGLLSKYMQDPGPAHWAAVKRVFRYLQQTKEFCLQYSGMEDTAIQGYCDADWGGDIDSRRSTTGFVFKVGGGAVSWNSKQQQSVALSTLEAEDMEAAAATKEAVWMRRLFSELGKPQLNSTLIKTDRQGSMAFMKNPVQHQRTKHIDVRYHFIREKSA